MTSRRLSISCTDETAYGVAGVGRCCTAGGIAGTSLLAVLGPTPVREFTNHTMKPATTTAITTVQKVRQYQRSELQDIVSSSLTFQIKL
jgi:hypothetical protein